MVYVVLFLQETHNKLHYKKSLTTVSSFQINKLCVFNNFGNYFEEKKLKLVTIRMCNGKWSLVFLDFLHKLILKNFMSRFVLVSHGVFLLKKSLLQDM